VHDSESFANLLTAAVWELTRDDELVLHCSIAGGRKTMSAYLAMIMQFFARPQDRLYHVLIGAAEFENNPQYYYPPPQPRWITDREGYAVSTDQAGLVLVEIPFIRLRGQIKEFQDQYYSFTQMVEIAQKWIQSPPEHPRLILDARHCEVRIGDGRPIPMPKTRFFIYRWFAEFSRRRPDDVPLCDYERYFLHGGKQLPEEAKRLLCSFNEKFGEWTDEDFWPRVQQEISRINKQLREALASREVDPYLIAVKGRYAEKYYGILLDKRCITLL
jgi:hypothetical protein